MPNEQILLTEDDELDKLRMRNAARLAEARQKMGEKYLCHESKRVQRITPNQLTYDGKNNESQQG
jgi:hypothetical protein